MAEPILADSTRLVIGGVDTHKDFHVAAVVDGLGAELGTGTFATNASGYRALGDWLGSHGLVGLVGVEGTGSWGAGLSRYLTNAGIDVVEINRPNRQARRRSGKSDPLDALAAARAALAGLDAGAPKGTNGPVEAIRLIGLARRSAVTSRTKTMNQIRSILDTAPDQLRVRYRDLTPVKLIKAITATRPDPTKLADPGTAAAMSLRSLGRRWSFLTNQINEHDAQLRDMVTAAAPNLIALHCVGTHTAAALLICAGDNPDRLGSEAAFAALCGASPLPASSGRITGRHRLNRGGDRQANSALWRIVLARMAHDPRTRQYVTRRTSQGLSKRDIIRCLKRYVAREVYPIIVTDLTT